MASSGPRLTATASSSMPTTVCFGCPEVAYVQLTVPAEIAFVKQITLETVSHDQGSSDIEQSQKGTYRQSHSSFDADVVTSGGHERLRWHFQSNVHADSTPRHHISTWPKDDPGNKRFLRAAIHSIQSDDTIQIIPKAHFPAPPSRQKPSTRAWASRQQAKEIRVLKVLPGSFDSPLMCELVKTQLSDDEHVQFEALSYVWGDARQRRTIHLDGQLFHITMNLEAALKQLRYETDKTRTLWVDAICINQANWTERGSQIQMMGMIYSKASRVVVWLGQLMLHVREIKRLRGGMSKLLSHHDNGQPSATGDEESASEHGKSLTPSDLAQASDLLELPWFRRVWILQEVYNAREMIAQCGPQILPWSTILQINKVANHKLTVPGPASARVMPAAFSHLFTVTTVNEQTSNIPGYHTQPRPDSERLLDFFIAGLDLDATDPRDKLSALLHIFPAFTEAALQPDYSKDVSTVSCEFTRWWIISHRSLRILSAVHCAVGRTWQKLSTLPVPLERSKHPSWALSWCGKSAWGRASLALCPTSEHSDEENEEASAADCKEKLYHASLDTVPDIFLLTHNLNPRTLRLKGIKIGSIDRIEPFPFFGKHPQLKRFHKVYEKMFDPLNGHALYVSGTTTRMQRLPRPRLKDDHETAHIGYALETGGAVECHTPCFFAMPSGDRGLCPSTARVGDVVVVLYGGDVLYLLREIRSGSDGGQAFMFVGECFVRGSMKGQALGRVGLSHETFELG